MNKHKIQIATQLIWIRHEVARHKYKRWQTGNQPLHKTWQSTNRTASVLRIGVLHNE